MQLTAQANSWIGTVLLIYWLKDALRLIVKYVDIKSSAGHINLLLSFARFNSILIDILLQITCFLRLSTTNCPAARVKDELSLSVSCTGLVHSPLLNWVRSGLLRAWNTTVAR